MKALVIESDANDTIKSEEIDFSCTSEIERVKIIKKLGAGTLLCGGISLQLEGIISYLGIDVISWISGNADDILNKYFEGTLDPEKYKMPGVTKYKDHINNG